MSEEPNVQQAVPFFMVSDLQASLRFYVDGLQFALKHEWVDEGRLRWCWLQLGGAALMLQERRKDAPVAGKPGVGVSVAFQCRDALRIFRETAARGLAVKQTPFVGNHLWVVPFTDPDGYAVDFESPTEVPEDTVLGEAGSSGAG